MARRLRPASLARRMLIGFLMICAALMLLPAPQASASPSSVSDEQDDVSLTLDGSTALPVPITAPRPTPFLSLSELLGAGTTMGSTPVALTRSGEPIALGAPGGSSAITLGADDDCAWYNILCGGGWVKTGIRVYACTNGAVILPVLAAHACIQVVSDLVMKAAAWFLKEALRAILYQFNMAIKKAVASMTTYLMVHVLGGSQSLSPILDCGMYERFNSGSHDGCNNSWFIGQYQIMRLIGLFLIPPLLLLVIMQSIIRGSLFFLLRAFLVCLPIAVLGSVVFTVVVQLLVNIADDMSRYLASVTTDPKVYGERFAESLNQMDNKFGFFTAIWLLLLLLSYIIILIELLLREFGIYLTMLFAPLAFATFVYPVLFKWLNRAVNVVFGFILLPVFIQAGLSLGFAAMASGADTIPGDGTDTTISQIILATIVMIFVGFGGTKILSFTPVQSAKQIGLASPANVLGMGDFTAQRLSAASQRADNRLGDAAEGGDGRGRVLKTVGAVKRGAGSAVSAARGSGGSRGPGGSTRPGGRDSGSGGGGSSRPTPAPPPPSGPKKRSDSS